MNKEETIARYGIEAYDKCLVQSKAYQKMHPVEVAAMKAVYNVERCRKSGNNGAGGMIEYKETNRRPFLYCGVCKQAMQLSRWDMIYRRICFSLERVLGPYTFWFKCPYCETKIWAQSYLMME